MAEKSWHAKGKTGAHTEADGGHGGGFPPFESYTFASQLVSLAIAFVALYLIVSRMALPRVGGVIDARQNAIEGDMAQAQKLKDESDAALKAYEAELAAARSRAQAIGNETREKLNAARKPSARRWKNSCRQARRRREDNRGDARSGDEQRPRHRRGCGRRIVQRLTGMMPDGKRWTAPSMPR